MLFAARRPHSRLAGEDKFRLGNTALTATAPKSRLGCTFNSKSRRALVRPDSPHQPLAWGVFSARWGAEWKSPKRSGDFQRETALAMAVSTTSREGVH